MNNTSPPYNGSAPHSEGIPAYVRIIQELVHDIETNRYGPGDKLPTETELMRRFGVSRTTARTARAKLASRGLIEIRRPEGAFVVKREPRGRVLFRRDDLAINIRMPTVAEIAALDLLEVGEPIVEIIRANGDREVHSCLSNRFAVE